MCQIQSRIFMWKKFVFGTCLVHSWQKDRPLLLTYSIMYEKAVIVYLYHHEATSFLCVWMVSTRWMNTIADVVEESPVYTNINKRWTGSVEKVFLVKVNQWSSTCRRCSGWWMWTWMIDQTSSTSWKVDLEEHLRVIKWYWLFYCISTFWSKIASFLVILYYYSCFENQRP